jgi:threonine dehydrogenase-like Zn-dependent dehydrogenase
MKAMVFDKALRIEDRPKPLASGRECLIRLLKAGICNTDIEITKGYFGFTGVLGHEFVGIVESAPTASMVGQRVVGEINIACQTCVYCQKGLQRHCPHRSVLGILKRDGAFREFLTLPEENLHVVPSSISNDDAVFTEPLAAACEILDQVPIGPEHRVAVLGDGKLGLLVAMVLSTTGCHLTLVGKHMTKMDLVKDYPLQRVDAELVDHLSGSFEVVVEATGSPQGWESALRLVRPRGTVVLKSTYHGQIAFNPAPIVVNEITVVGSRCGRFEAALALLTDKKVSPTVLLQQTLPLREAIRAFELAQQPGVLKVALTP